jgi:hypothetical protein
MPASTRRSLGRTDEGASWIELPIPIPASQRQYPSLADPTVDPRVPTALYAVIHCAGVIKSVDGGATWSVINSGLTDVLQAFGLDLSGRSS